MKIINCFLLISVLSILLISCSDHVNNIQTHQVIESQIADPSVTYCEELGYNVKIIKTERGESSICELRKGLQKVDCDTWDFFNGKCGTEFSYCEQNNGKIITKQDKLCKFSSECAFCILNDNLECTEWAFFRSECLQ
jgi:putative hemolysin